MRAQKKRVKDIARQLNVSIDSVERWLRAYRKHRIGGIRARKPTGRPARKRKPAEARMRRLLRQDPQAFGFLKGRWVVRYIAKALSQEGIKVSKSYVRDMLRELDLRYKRPRLEVRSNDPNYYRKAGEVSNYKQAAAMLVKKGVIVAFEDETWTSLYPRIEAKWMKKGVQERVLTLDHNRRRNVFTMLFWPKKNGFLWNRFGEEKVRGVQAQPLQPHPVH